MTTFLSPKICEDPARMEQAISLVGISVFCSGILSLRAL